MEVMVDTEAEESMEEEVDTEVVDMVVAAMEVEVMVEAGASTAVEEEAMVVEAMEEDMADMEKENELWTNIFRVGTIGNIFVRIFDNLS